MSEGTIATTDLRLLIERIERLEEEKKAISEDIKDVYGEAKSRGYDVKTIRECVKLRKMESHIRQERDALLETYRAALGIDFSETPLGRATVERESDKETTISVTGRPAVPLGTVKAAVDIVQNRKGLGDDGQRYGDAVALVREANKASTSYLQRRLGIGFNAAAGLIERMEREGIVSAPDAQGKRSVVAKRDEAA